MIYFIITAGFIGILFYYFLIHRKKVLLNTMISAIDTVKMGIYSKLTIKFKVKYEEKKAKMLSAAITNELFSEAPSNSEGKNFLESNIDIVEEEMSALQNDKEICNIVTQAIRVKSIVYYAKDSQVQKNMFDPIDKLKKFGIFIPGGDSVSPEKFMQLANEFFQSTQIEK